MKTLNIFSFVIIFSAIIFSCTNDQEDFGPMKGINYFSRHDSYRSQEVSFENGVGVVSDTLKKSVVISVDPNTFTNEDGSAYTGKVVLSVAGEYVRGYMALNCVPSTSNGSALNVEASINVEAVDLQGHKLKIASGKNLTIAVPGGTSAQQNKMYYGDDNVKDPSPISTSLFNWKEASADLVESYFDSNSSLFFYRLKPTQTGWVCCAQVVSNSDPVGITVRVKGISTISYTNTAVYVVPVNGKSAFRLWNYDHAANLFSLDQPYLNNGDEVYVIAISSLRHFKLYFAKDHFTVGSNTEVIIDATETTYNSMATNLYYL